MLVAIVVTYSVPAEVLERCLAALAAGGGVDHVLVYDTGGAARVPDQVGDLPVELWRIPNDGYGAAANEGFARARVLGAEFVALLNDDVFVRPGWLGPLLAALEPVAIGAVQPVVLADGGATVLSRGVRIDRYGAGTDLGDGEPFVQAAPAAAPEPLRLFTGGAVVFRAAFLEATGGFDPRWFLYYEDVDLARRGALLGWLYRLAPNSVVEHARSVSAGALPERTRFLQERNRLWAAFRYESPVTVVRAVGLSVRRLRHAPRGVHARALAAGLAGAPTMLWRRLRP